LEQLHREYQQKGISIVSINAIDQDSLDKVQNTIGQFSMTHPVLLDQGSQFASTYQMFFFPTTILIDASGVIREITLGDSTEAELRASLDRVLAGGL
jgi:peroxiredoxin